MPPAASTKVVHLASAEVYRQHGCELCYRTGRAIGYSALKRLQVKAGDRTVLRPGMAFAVDGGITLPGGFGARVGDTLVVTARGTECVAESPRDRLVV